MPEIFDDVGHRLGGAGEFPATLLPARLDIAPGGRIEVAGRLQEYPRIRRGIAAPELEGPDGAGRSGSLRSKSEALWA